MKKALLVLALIFFLTTLVVTVFILTFNVNQHKPMVEKQISSVLGAPARIQSLSLGWKSGIGFKVSGLSVQNPKKLEETILRADEIMAQLEMAPLFKKQIQITEIFIDRPELLVEKLASGSVGLKGCIGQAPENTNGTSRSDSQGQSRAFSVTISRIRVKEGVLEYVDHSNPIPQVVRVDSMGIEIHHFNIGSAFDFKYQAALWSAKPNIEISGQATLSNDLKSILIQDAKIRTQFQSIEPERMHASWAQTAKMMTDMKPKGELDILIPRLDLANAMNLSNTAKVELKNASMDLPSMSQSLTDVQAKILMRGAQIQLESLQATLAGGKILAKGSTDGLGSAQVVSQYRVQVEGIKLEALVAGQKGNAPHLSGHLSMVSDLSFVGLDWPSVSHSLSGAGQINLQDGVILNYNLLREVVSKLEAIPGMFLILQKNLPEKFRVKMNQAYTVLKPISQPFMLDKGNIIFSPILIGMEDAHIQGGLLIGMDQSINGNATLTFSPELSGVLVQLVPALQAFSNAGGQFEIPLTIQGTLSHIRVLPSTEFILSRLITARPEQILQNLPSGILSGKSKGSDLLGALLGKKES